MIIPLNIRKFQSKKDKKSINRTIKNYKQKNNNNNTYPDRQVEVYSTYQHLGNHHAEHKL